MRILATGRVEGSRNGQRSSGATQAAGKIKRMPGKSKTRKRRLAVWALQAEFGGLNALSAKADVACCLIIAL